MRINRYPEGGVVHPTPSNILQWTYFLSLAHWKWKSTFHVSVSIAQLIIIPSWGILRRGQDVGIFRVPVTWSTPHRIASHRMVVVVITRFEYRERTVPPQMSWLRSFFFLLERSGFPSIFACSIHPSYFPCEPAVSQGSLDPGASYSCCVTGRDYKKGVKSRKGGGMKEPGYRGWDRTRTE